MAGECVFCEIVAGRAPASVVWEDESLMAFLDIHPARPGHMLVVPRGHAQFVSEMTEEAVGRLLAVGRRLAAAVRASDIPCEDVNFLLNDGPAANQTVPHVHLHVVPRCRGDFLRVAAALARHGLGPLNRPTPRAELDRVAAQIRAQL